nr:MAG: capsid protein [Cressdnaviricota sp.]
MTIKPSFWKDRALWSGAGALGTAFMGKGKGGGGGGMGPHPFIGPRTGRRGKKNHSKLPTKTKRKKKKPTTQVAGSALAGLVLSTTTVKKGSKRNKYETIKAITNRQTYKYDGYGTLTSNQSAQGVAYLQVFTPTQIITAYNSTKFWNTSAVANNIATAGYQSSKLMLDDWSAYADLTNQAPSNVNVVVYLLLAKTTAPAFVDPITAWNNGLLDQVTSGVSFDSTRLGVCPTQSKQFNILWKIKGKHVFNMQPGETAKSNWRIKYKKLFDSEYLEQFNMIAGFTPAIMYVVRGQVGDNSKAKLNPMPGVTSFVNLTVAKVDLIYNAVFNFRHMNAMPRGTHYATTQLTPQLTNFVQDSTSGVILDANLDANFA